MKQLILLFFSLIIFTHCSSPTKETPISKSVQNHVVLPPSNKITTSLNTKEKNEQQNNYISKDSVASTAPNADYFVINLQGAKVYNKPNFNTEILSILENGKGIQQKNLLQLQNDELKINEGITLEGHWLEINQPVQGYIFSSDFSTIRPIVTHYLINKINLLGKQIGETVFKDTTLQFPSMKFQTEMEILKYQYATYKYIIGDGCFDHYYYFKNLKLHEVYHHMMNDHTYVHGDLDNIQLDIPSFKKVKGNQIIFDGVEATGDLILYKKASSQYEIYSNDCT